MIHAPRPAHARLVIAQLTTSSLITARSLLHALLLMLTMVWAAPAQAHTTSSEPLRLSVDALTEKMRNNRYASHLLTLNHQPKCAVEVHSFNYENGVLNESSDTEFTTRQGTGTMLIPYSPDSRSARCRGPLPAVLYLHMKNNRAGYDLAALNDSSNPAYDEALTIAALYASHGYIVVAPHYLSNNGTTRPYITAIDSIVLGNEAVDAYLDAMALLPGMAAGRSVRPSGKLLVTGYGEGAAVATSASSHLDVSGVKVTATSAGSGPYAIPSFNEYALATELGQTEKDPQTQTLLRNLALSFQYSYGNIYTPTQASQLGSSAYLRQYRAAANNGTPHPLRDAINRNYVRLITTPDNPVLLCGSSRDEVVPYFNTETLLEFHNQGQSEADTRQTSATLLTLDLATSQIDMPVNYPAKLKLFPNAFQAANRKAKRQSQPAITALDYHERMFPFCGLAGLRYFGPMLNATTVNPS